MGNFSARRQTPARRCHQRPAANARRTREQVQSPNSKIQSRRDFSCRAFAKNISTGRIENRTRTLKRGEKIAPLDLTEFLEGQGYEPEAQVSQKGEIALRGGILDIFPPTSLWPARLEFFGDELESLREFDPLTQISREEISEITIPPAGELGILKNSIQNSEV